ncbi:MAG: DUF4143 domain-containing protein [Candidatus Omnitrophica bacterium]|nr:DUF4143 domain-containing protein [Candidatus Omnitrophota bacterium]
MILERLFVIFRISPFGNPKIRAVKKEQKAYMWDWSLVEEPGTRYENFVASQLLKYCDYLEDAEGRRMELRYLRDTDKREVDFVVVQNGTPLFGVECKINEQKVSNVIAYYANRLPIPQFYQVHLGKKDYEHATLPVRVCPFEAFVKECRLP